MKKISMNIIVIMVFLLGWIDKADAHFGMIIPSDDIITQDDNNTVKLEIKFIHPMENSYMDMEKPVEFGVRIGDKKINLLKSLKERKGRGDGQKEDFTCWGGTYKIKRPGDCTFYVEPKPYWEPAEDCYIIHYTKVCVNAFGLEQGWDNELGLETEIVPLTRPYGLWTGNIFAGVVLVKGKPVPYAEVEVEYYDQEGGIEPPADPYITQVLKADKNGVFSYAMPKAGWWGFAALNQASWKIKRPDGKEKAVEIGAVYWVKTRDMK